MDWEKREQRAALGRKLGLGLRPVLVLSCLNQTPGELHGGRKAFICIVFQVELEQDRGSWCVAETFRERRRRARDQLIQELPQEPVPRSGAERVEQPCPVV